MIDFRVVRNIIIPEGIVASITCDAKLLWKKTAFPSEYQIVDYLESTGTQYIDTGYIPNNATKVELVISGVSKDSFAMSTGTWFIGARQGYLQRAFGFYYDPSKSKFYFAFGNAMPSASYTTLYNTQKQLTVSGAGMFADGVKVVGATASSFTAPVPLVLFALNNNGSVISHTRYKMHSCKIWEGEVLKKDFIPCYRKSDGKPGMYDIITQEFFTNAGTGEFICEKPAYKLELAYLESSGTQWIDTGVTMNTTTDEFEFVFQGIGKTIYKWFFGEHDDGARFGLGSGDGTNKRNVAYGKTTYKVKDTQMYDTIHRFNANLNGTFLDDVKITNYAAFSSISTLYLFNLNLNNVAYMSSVRIWSCKHKRNGVLIRDFIPVLDWNDRPCLYDKVSGELFYNQGTGEFLYGEIE